MRIRRRSVWTFVLILTPFVAAPARLSAQEVTSKLLRFRVGEVLRTWGDSAELKLEGGTAAGIEAGMEGSLFGVWQDTIPGRGGNEIGSARVVSADSVTAIALGRLTEPGTAAGMVYPGDLIALELQERYSATPGLFTELVTFRIDLYDDEGNPFYRLWQVLFRDGDSLATANLQAMAETLHRVAQRLSPQAGDTGMLNQPLTAAPYQSRSILQVFAEAAPSDVARFLDYITSYPGRYVGRHLSLASQFGQWLFDDARPGQRSVRDELLAAPGDAERRRLIEAQADALSDGVWLDSWKAVAVAWSEAGRIEEARALNHVAQMVAEIYHLDRWLGLLLFAGAEIEDNARQREAAIASYRAAIEVFRRTGDEKAVRYSLNNIASQYNQLGKYVAAVAIWDTVIALERARSLADSSDEQRVSLGISLTGYGRALEKIDRYSEALAVYDESARLFAAVGGREESRRAYALSSMAGIYGKQGDRERAIRTYGEARMVYQAIRDPEGEADQLDEIGRETFGLGQYRDAKAIWEQAYDLHIVSGDSGDAGYSQSQIGQAAWNLGDYQGAIAAHTRATQLRRQAGDNAGMAYSLDKLASLYRESGDPTRALVAYREVAPLYHGLEDYGAEANVLNSMGDVYYNEKDYPRAVATYHEARAIHERLELPRDLALDYYDLGDAFYQQRLFDSAGVYYAKGAVIQRAIGDEWNLIASLNSMALVLEADVSGRTQAEAYYREALGLAQKLDAKKLVADCYAALSRSAFRRGQLDSAVTYRREALGIYRALEDRRAEALQLLAIGEVETQRGELTRALATYDEARAIAEAANRRTEVGDILTATSFVRLLLGEYPEAVEVQERALAISQEVENPWGTAAALTNLGNIHNGMGDYQKAIDFYQRAESMYVALQDPLSQATPINNIGTIYYWQGDYPQALVQFHRALAIVKERDPDGEFLPLLNGNVGEVFYEQGSYDEADGWLIEALTGARAAHSARIQATALTLLGKTALARGDRTKAAEWLAAADTVVRRMGTRDRIAEVLTQQGKVAVAGRDLVGARPLLEEAVRLAREIGASKYLWEPLYLLGTLRRDQGDSAAALAILEEAIGVLEQLRSRVTGGEGAQKLFASGQVQGRLYEALVSLLIRQGDTQRALDVLQRSMNEELRSKFTGLAIQFADSAKARLLAEEARRKSQVDGVGAELSRELAAPDSLQNKEKIATLRSARSVAEQEYVAFLNQLISRYPDLKDHTRVDLRQLRGSKRALPGDVALLAYLPGERELYIFVVTSDTVVAKVVEVPRDSLDRLVDVMVKLARSPSATFASVQRAGAAGAAPAARPEGDVRTQAALLYRLLIEPVEQELGQRKRLAIAPSGSLYYLPFQILGQGPDSAFQTVAEQRTIFYVTGINVPPAEPGPKPQIRMVAFGDADSTLPNAEREVMDLKRMYPTAMVYLHHQATEARAKVLPATFNVVHFATHGNLDYTDFENSYLTLAPSDDGDEDGRLTLAEVWSLQGFDQRKLVVLSACNTAVPEERVAGWPNSPATAFLDVGVPTVIASLWPVDDAATSELITAFYRNLRTMDTAEALHQAQLSLKANPKYAHPFFWGAWVLVGDWR